MTNEQAEIDGQAEASAQIGMWDREVKEQPSLELAAEIVVTYERKLAQLIEDLAADYQVKPSKIKQAKKQFNAALEGVDLKEGERLRIGPYVIEGRRRTGNERTVDFPAFDKITAGKVTKLPEEPQ